MRNVIKLEDHRPLPKPERNFVAVMHRCSQHMEDRGEKTTRRYLSLDNAVTLTARWGMLVGRPGDVIIIHHAQTGLELGYVRVQKRGHLTVKWQHL